MPNLIEAWLDLPSAGVFGILILLYFGTGTLIVWAAYGGPIGPRTRLLDGVVAPFFGSVSILFALMAGFLASDISDRNRQASRAVQAEVAELRNVFTLSVASASDMQAIREDWAAYVKAVVGDEWKAMTDGDSAPSAAAAYDALLREVSQPKIATEAGAAVHSALLTAAVRVGTARSERLALASDNTSELKWAMVLMLGIMTQIAIGLVHLQKRNAHIAALSVFSIAAVLALGLIALQEHPFAGDVRLSPTPLQELLKKMNGPNGPAS
jgi:ABC-type multidrug transport system fused ATPase/permease subunit